MKSRSVSITGATGFLGWHLSAAFRDAGWQVRAIVRRGNTKPLPDGVTVVESALDRESLATALGDSSLLVHSAALVRAATDSEIDRVNVGGTRAAVDAANDVGARVLFISSLAAIGPGTAARPCREDDPPHPITAYGRSKLAAEAVVRSQARVPWTIVRPSAVYGPRDRGFQPLFRLASHGISLMVASPATPFTFIYVDDLIAALMAAATDERAVGQTMFLGHPAPETADGLMRALADAFGRTYRPVRLPSFVMQIAGAAGDVCWKLGLKPAVDGARAAEIRAGGFVCAVDRAREVLGFTAAVPLWDGVARTVRWYRDQGWV
jgi:nucleoside-diphosphate-sugar epimerase